MLSEIRPGQEPLSVIFGLSGTELTKDERFFFRESNPLGFILFARNCKTPEQLRSLTNSLQDCLGREAPVLIDQEGGRVMRLKAPHWQDRPAAKIFVDIYKIEPDKGINAANQNIAAISTDLRAAGINVNCVPVLDVLQPDTHEAIGDRAFSDDPVIVTMLGEQAIRACLQNGIIPVMKHLPGQGRAVLDSHKDLPVIRASLQELKEVDFLPFKRIMTGASYQKNMSHTHPSLRATNGSEAIQNSGSPRHLAAARDDDVPYPIWGMVAHVIYEALDDEHPASCSRKVIEGTIREDLGFDGLLLSDDIEMNALKKYGSAAERVNIILQAGCDISLHCNGKMAEMLNIANNVPAMSARSVERYNKSVSLSLQGEGCESLVNRR